MSEFYQISLGLFDGVFAVPMLVADRLKMVDAKALKPLLYLLSRNGARISVEDIARATRLSTAEVRDGLDFWVNEGILRREEGEYLPDTSPRFSAAPEVAEAAGVSSAQAAAPVQAGQGTDAGRRLRTSSRPAKLAPGEAATRCEQDAEIRFMVEKSEQLLGRPLNTSDISTLISLVDWAGLSPDLVLMLVSHCRDLGKTNLRYIERVGADWAERGIDSHEKAEALILRQTEEQEREREIVTAFGLSGRALTTKEREYVAEWYGAFGFDLRMIRLAYERCVDNTTKLSFPYIHKILRTWHDKGFKEPRDAAGEAAPTVRRGEKEAGQSTMDYDLAEQMLYQNGN